MESPTKKKKNEHHTEEIPFSPFPISPSMFLTSPITNPTPLTNLLNDAAMSPSFLGMTPSRPDNALVAPSSRDWTPSIANFNMPENFDFGMMSPPQAMKNSRKTKKDFASPLIADLHENDLAFDSEAQTHLNKNKEALANRINKSKNNSRPSFPPTSANNFPSMFNNKNFPETSLLSDYHVDSTSSSQLKFGIAEKPHFLSDSLPTSQSSDNSGLLAITAAAEQLPPPPAVKTLDGGMPNNNGNNANNNNRTTISHPKKQRLKTKDDVDSAPASPAKPPATLNLSNFPEGEQIRQLAMAGPTFLNSGIVKSATIQQNNSNNGHSYHHSSHNPSNNNSINSGAYGNQAQQSHAKNYHQQQQQQPQGNLKQSSQQQMNQSPEDNKSKIQEILQLGIARAAQQRADENKAVTCNCKKSKCLKMYCDCFRLTEFCKQHCNCFECNNLPQFEDQRQLAIKSITERNPEAFKPRVTEEANKNKAHLTGCHCRKSACLKKYCECFNGNVPCGNRCRCIDCKNVSELYDLDENTRKQAFSLTNNGNYNNNNNNSKTPTGANRSTSFPSSSSANKKDNNSNGTNLFKSSLSLMQGQSLLSSNPTASLLNASYLVESDHSNLTASSTLHSLHSELSNHSGQFNQQGNNNNNQFSPFHMDDNGNNNNEKLSIDTSPSMIQKYKAMSSPELKMILKTISDDGQMVGGLRQIDSAGSESTNGIATGKTMKSIGGITPPTSPLRTIPRGDDPLLSPIKLLELASVCSERQEQEQQLQNILSSPLRVNLSKHLSDDENEDDDNDRKKADGNEEGDDEDL